MHAVAIRSDLAPLAAMQRAIDLIEQSGLPMHEFVFEAGRTLSAALSQANIVGFEDNEVPASKVNSRINTLQGLAATAWQVSEQKCLNALADCERTLRRIIARGTPLPEEYERIELVQRRGPTIEASARLLCSTSFETRRGEPMEIVLELWETQGGAWIAVSAANLPGGEGREDLRALVVPPGDDAQARRHTVLDHFDWHERARSMLVKKLGWSLREDVA